MSGQNEITQLLKLYNDGIIDDKALNNALSILKQPEKQKETPQGENTALANLRKRRRKNKDKKKPKPTEQTLCGYLKS